MTTSQRHSLFALLVMVVFVSSCAMFQVTPKQQFLAADKEFTTAVTKYNTYYDAADKELQEEWRKDIDPVILDCDEAMDVWRDVVSINGDSAEAEAKFLKLKTKLLLLLSEKVFAEDT